MGLGAVPASRTLHYMRTIGPGSTPVFVGTVLLVTVAPSVAGPTGCRAPAVSLREQICQAQGDQATDGLLGCRIANRAGRQVQQQLNCLVRVTDGV